MKEAIRIKLKELPLSSGIYIMRDNKGEILYIGKASNLKNRVRSYFNNATKTEKVMALMQKVEDFDYILTNSEVEALVLENTLIKKHQPHYNILLKDDKLYPFLRIDVTKDFPCVEVVRRLKADKAKYFGPYMIGISASEMLRLVNGAFALRECKLNMNKIPSGHRPCLNYHIGRCLAPCCKKVSREEYAAVVAEVIAFLNGNDKSLKKKLEAKMYASSEKMEYELAKQYKDMLETVDKMVRRQIAAVPKDFNLDIFGIASGAGRCAIATVIVRGGKIVAGDKYAIQDASLELSGTMSSFVSQYYQDKVLADEVVCSITLSDSSAISDLLTQRKGSKVTVSCPKGGVRRQLAQMADKNAEEYLSRSTEAISRVQNLTVGAMEQLTDILKLPSLAVRMECYDISNISGTDKVASMVVFERGDKCSKKYRTFRIKTVKGADDFACMKETLARRFERLKEGKDDSFGELPNLIVIDGGKGQLKFAQEAMKQAGYNIPMIGLAKKEETIITPDGREISLPKTSFALKLLMRIRDEAHRFAINYHRRLRGTHALESKLKEIDGVGEAKIKALYKHFGSYDKIAAADIDSLLKVPRMDKRTAANIIQFFAPLTVNNNEKR